MSIIRGINTPTLKTKKTATTTKKATDTYSVEFFHIYTDETIQTSHLASVKYLKTIQTAWDFSFEPIILIDDYNPTVHTLSVTEVFSFLKVQNTEPKFWAREADLVPNAKLLLAKVANPKLRNNYRRYIEQHQKYPCSLLTASWYLTRLGQLNSDGVIRANGRRKYKPATRLINILPQDYRKIEMRARDLILHSDFEEYADRVQDLFYPVGSYRKLDIF